MPTIAQQFIEEGRKQEILETIEFDLKLKFSGEGLSELTEIRKINEIDLLRTVRQAIRTVRNIDGLRRIYRYN